MAKDEEMKDEYNVNSNSEFQNNEIPNQNQDTLNNLK